MGLWIKQILSTSIYAVHVIIIMTSVCNSVSIYAVHVIIIMTSVCNSVESEG